MVHPVGPQGDEGDDGEAVVVGVLAWVAVDPGAEEGEGQQTACPLRQWVQGPEVEDPMADREQSAQAEVVEEVGSGRLVKEAQLALRSAPCGGPLPCGRLVVDPKKGADPLSGDAPCLGLLGCTARLRLRRRLLLRLTAGTPGRCPPWVAEPAAVGLERAHLLGAVLAEGARQSWVAGAGVALTGQSAVLTRPPQ